MATRRMISNSLGDSEKFAALKNDTHRTAYMLLVTWADCEGRFAADAISLKGKLYTRLPWAPATVEAALADMDRVQLIDLYEVGGKRYGVIRGFHLHNTISRDSKGVPTREAPSSLPAPPEAPRTRSAPTAQEPRSDRAAVAPEVEVEVEVEGEVEVQSTPSPKTAATTDDEDDGQVVIDQALTAVDRRRARNYSTGILAQQHPHTHAGLQDLQGVYKFAPPQYSIYASKLLELARDHGDELTAAALEAVVLSAERIKQPLPYIKKILTNHAAESARLGTTEVGAIDFKGDLDRLFGAN